MADKEYNVNISVTDTGAKATGNRVDGIGRKAKKSASGVNLLRSALGALGISLSVNELIKFSDAWTKINSRLRLVTTSAANFIKTQRQLFDISTKTRTDITDNVKLYQRLALAQDNLGASQEQMLIVTEAVGKSLAILGVSSTEARGALLQLGQAFSNPLLQAQEFNSILDGIPIIAQAAAKALGLTVGEFRQAVNTQKISGKTFFNAILSQADVLDKQFGQVTQTIGQSFTLIKNELVKFIGATGESSGAVKAFVDSLTLLAINIDKVVVGVAIFGFVSALLILKSVIVAVAGATGITLLIKGIWLLTKAMTVAALTNLSVTASFTAVKTGIISTSGVLLIFMKGLGALILLAGKAIGVLALLGAAFSFGFAVGDAIVDPLEAGLNAAIVNLESFAQKFKSVMSFIAGSISFESMKIELEGISKATESTINKIKVDLEKKIGDSNLFDRMGDSFGSQMDFIKKKSKEGSNFINEAFGDINADSGLNEFEKLSRGVKESTQDTIDGATGLGEGIKKAINIDSVSDELDPKNWFESGFDFLVDAAKDAGNEIKDFLSQKVMEARSDTKSGLSAEMQSLIDAAKKSIGAEAEAFKPKNIKAYKNEIKELIKHLRPADMREYGKEADKVFSKISNMKTDQSIKELDKLKEKLLELPQVFGAIDASFKGVQAGFNSWADDATDIFGGMEQLTKSTLDSMTDSIIEFTETGKFNFRQFVADVNKELLKMSIKGVLGSGLNLLKDGLPSLFKAASGPSDNTAQTTGQAVGGLVTAANASKEGAVTVVNPSSDVLANQQVIQGQEQMGFLAQIGSGISGLFTSFTGIFSKIFTALGDTAATAISQLSALFGISTAQASSTLSITTLLSSLITTNASGFAAIAASNQTAAISGAFSGAAGGGAGGLGPLLGPGFQMGGNYTGNEAFMAGEHGREMIIPNGSGRVLKNSDTEDALGDEGSGKGPNIINVLDPDLASQYIRSSNGERDIINIISTNREQVKAMIK